MGLPLLDVQCILYGLISVFLCVPFIFADDESVDLVAANCPYFSSGYFNYRDSSTAV